MVGISIKQSGVVAGDGVSEQVAQDVIASRVLGACGGVVNFSGDFGGMGIRFGREVGLPFGGELPEVMPEAGDVAPLVGRFGFLGIFREHFGGEFCSLVGDFVEVSVVVIHTLAFLAGVALALVFAFAEGGEEGFPFALGGG